MYQSSAGERRGSPPSLEGLACDPYRGIAFSRLIAALPGLRCLDPTPSWVENPAFRGLRRLRLAPALPRSVSAHQLADPVVRTGARDGLGFRPNSAVQ